MPAGASERATGLEGVDLFFDLDEVPLGVSATVAIHVSANGEGEIDSQLAEVLSSDHFPPPKVKISALRKQICTATRTQNWKSLGILHLQG